MGNTCIKIRYYAVVLQETTEWSIIFKKIYIPLSFRLELHSTELMCEKMLVNPSLSLSLCLFSAFSSRDCTLLFSALHISFKDLHKVCKILSHSTTTIHTPSTILQVGTFTHIHFLGGTGQHTHRKPQQHHQTRNMTIIISYHHCHSTYYNIM